MADPNQVITQLAATRQAAQAASDAANSVLAAELGNLQPNAQVIQLCSDTIAKSQTTIAQCDKHVVAAILSQNNADQWLASLATLTGQMSAQSAALTADVNALTTLKSVASAVAGMLVLLGV